MNKYELAEKDYKAGMKYKDIADKYGVTMNTVKSWKQRYSWTREGAEKKTSVCTQNKKSMHTKKDIPTKQKKEIARVMIEEGATIRETADKVGLPRSTVGDISSKENLQQSQLKYLKSFHEDMRERIKTNKLKRLSLNEEALYSVEEEINAGEVGKATFEKIKLSEEIEQSIFEVNRIDRLERLELEKLKVIKPDEEDTEDNILQIEVLD